MSSSQYQNGRVIMNNNQTVKDMNMIEGNKTNNNFQVESLYGIQETSKLNQLFFSKMNLDIIQNNIRYTVYNKTNKKHIIGKQSDIELQIVMRSTYLQHSPNLEYKYKEQIEYLNNLVVDWSVSQIIPQLEQYIGYLKEVEYMPLPIDLPVNLSSKGSRTLRSVTSTF
jgi:hypothetical protein